MTRTGFASTILICALVAFSQPALSMGMRVTPGGAVIQGVQPGVRLEVPLPLTVINDGEQPQRVSFGAIAPAQRRMKLPPGYADIPDPSWMTFGEEEIVIPPKRHASVKMFLSVPAGAQYHDQHWSVAVAVRTTPAKGQMVSLGIYPRFEIETEPSPVSGKDGPAPLGQIVASPSTWEIEDWKLGGPARSVKLRIRNNTEKVWRGRTVIVSDVATAKKRRLAMSGRWTWPTNPDWVKTTSSEIEAPAGEWTEVTLEATPPKTDRVGGLGWETIVLFEGKEGPSTCARIRLKTLRAARPAEAGKPGEVRK